MGDQANRAKAIFLAAIEEHRPEQWPAFLDRACAGDAPLRAAVEKLLRAQVDLGSFHEAPPTSLYATAASSLSEAPGAVVGPYKLLELLGEGGFGIVFLAEQQAPIRRQVALKVLKPGMDTRQVVARFEAERQALTLMEHPNIARVLDAGATDSGRPYFVMELVKGVPITEFCDRQQLAPEARLRLFLDVCQAIQHAHHKGVVHRDIKPTNVLVALQGGTPAVKVIDFGVAKAMAQKLTEKTLFTAQGQMIGTPAYMSPEQAEMSGLDIDTRTDVYALGVLLYELLTGTTPLEGRRLQEAGYAEMQRLIREEEAPRPSTRLTVLGDSATALAGRRGLDVRRLTQLLAGDLDWAVMKALEKDRNRRYDTPASFAEDIERYLRREALLARPPSTLYKVKKFALRNRAAVLTGAAVAAALMAGAAVVGWQAVVATRATRDAQAREAETRAVLEFVENRMLAAARPKGQAGGLGPGATVRQAVEAALPCVAKSFTDQPLIEARLRLTMGRSFEYLGEAERAAEQCQRARALYTRHLGPDHLDTLRSVHHLACGYHDLGQYADARRLHEETLARQRAVLGPDHPDTLRSMHHLANSYAALCRRADALRLREETLTRRRAALGRDHPDTLVSMHSLANSYTVHSRHADAVKLRTETLALQKATLGPDHPDTLRSMNGLAASYSHLGLHADAVALYEETLAPQKARLGPDHPDALQTMYNLAISYAALGRHAAALELREETLALHQAKLGPDHPRTLMSMNNVASSYAALGRHADALKLYGETLALQRARLGPDHPDTLWGLSGVAHCLANLNRSAEALPVIDECLRHTAGKALRPYLLPGVIDLRLRHFEKLGDAAGCRQTAAMWEDLKRTDADSLYRAARLRAVTAAVCRAANPPPAGRTQADAEADRAMAWLEQAVAAGYTNAAHISQDRDLDALRSRADFTGLVTRLRARPPEKK
jgi:serine/threonine protein kinase